MKPEEDSFNSMLFQIFLSVPSIKPKKAVVEIECPIDEFFYDWEDDNTEDPTQEDYDKWACSKAMGFFECYRHELDNYIKLK